MNVETASGHDWMGDLDQIRGNKLYDCFTVDNSRTIFDRCSVPTKLSVGGVCICSKGFLKVIIDDRSYMVRQGDMCLMFPAQILQTVGCSDDFEAFTVSINPELIKSINIHSASVLYVYIKENPCITLNEQQMTLLVRLGELINQTVLPDDHLYRVEIVKHALLAFTYGIAAIYRQGEPLHRLPHTRQESLFRRFEYLLAQHYTDDRSVAYYADMLCITPKYLSLVVKQCSGHNAAEWIAHTVIVNAKALLADSELTIQQVSDRLNFPSPSFFGHYFKRLMGMTPKQYRQSR